MNYKNINLPATVIHTVNEKQYTLNGTLKSINESKNTCTIVFENNKVCKNVPLSEVYLNEGVLDMLKKAGRAVKDAGEALFNKITEVVKKIKGFIFPTDVDGTPLTQFVNAPCNVAAMRLPSSIESSYSPSIAEFDDENGLKTRGTTIDDLIGAAEERDAKEIEKYWSRVMKEYTKPENESLTLATTIKMVNEKYYHKVISDKVLNEACERTIRENVLNESGVIPSLKSLSGNYGKTVNTRQLVGRVAENIREQINPPVARKAGEGGQAKPLIIWGAPGIGKTAILGEAMDLVKDEFRLTMHTMKCAALKFDDFELPDTVKNVVGQKLAVSNPKTWLPVYNPHGLTQEQIELTDKIYNTGVYKIYQTDEETSYNRDGGAEAATIHHIDANQIENDVKQNKSDKIKDYIAKSQFDGGILFFDEFSRLDPRVTDIMMNLMGERTYGENFVLATKWCTLGAANRLSDDFKAESDEEFREIWGAAKDDRYQHYTYVPTKEEWLKWARKPNKKTGIQNISERFCKLIEVAPDYVWYATLENGGQEIGKEHKDVQDALKHAGHMTWDEQDAVGQYITSISDVAQTRLGSLITPRTWDEKVQRKVISQLIFLLGRDTELYDSVFSESTYTTMEKGKKVSYQRKDIDDAKLAKALQEVDDDKWNEWADGFIDDVDPGEKFVYDPKKRIKFWDGWINKVVIPEALGELTKANQYIQKFQDPADAINIWEEGEFKDKTSRAEDKLAMDQSLYATETSTMAWKANTEDIKNFINLIMKSYPGSLTNDIIKDFKDMSNISDRSITPADRNQYQKMFTIEYIEDGEDKQYYIYNGNRIDQASLDTQIFILKNSLVARQFLNVGRWLCRVIQETGVGSLASFGSEELIKLYNSKINDPKLKEAAKFFNNNGLNLFIPAVSVLSVMEQINI